MRVWHGESDAEAEGKKAAYLRSIRDTRPVIPTFHEFAKDVWLPSIQHLAPLTRRKYELAYRAYLRDRLGPMPIDSIRYADCQKAINSLKCAAASIRFAKSMLVTILNLAERDELLSRNPARLVAVPNRPPARERMMSPAEILELLAKADETPISASIFLALVLGLRRAEVCGLKWDDLDRRKAVLYIRRQVQNLKADGGIVARPLKSKNGKRSLPLTPEIVAEIDRRGDLDSIWICGSRETPLDPEGLYRQFAKHRSALGLDDDFTYHDLRRCAASLLFETGTDPLRATKVLGHKEASMSAYYMSVQNSTAGDAIEKLSRALFNR